MCRSAGSRLHRRTCSRVLTVTLESRAGWAGQSCHIMARRYGTALRHGATARRSDSRRLHHAPQALPAPLPIGGRLAAGLRCGCLQEASFSVLHPKQAGNLPPHRLHRGRLRKEVR